MSNKENDALPPLPEPDYHAGTKGMLVENCWASDTVEAYGRACMALRQPSAPQTHSADLLARIATRTGLRGMIGTQYTNALIGPALLRFLEELHATPAAPVSQPAAREPVGTMGIFTGACDVTWEHGRIPAVGAKLYTAPQPLSAPAGSEQEKIDAARWNALLNSPRIRMLGSAGLNQPEPNNYAHFGMEIWSRYSRNYSDKLLDGMDKGNAQGREWLTKYADIALAAQQEQGK